MSILEIKNLTHTFDNRLLFDHADLVINNGEHVGIVGLNGAGKSTFINIIGGNVVQDEGEVNWLGGIRRGYLDQHADIDRSLTVMEYLKSSFNRLFDLNAKMEQLYVDMERVTDENELDRMITRANNILDTLTREGFFELDATIKKVANGLGVGSFGYDTPVANLSGGQRAKLMLSKLLLEQPDIMMLDEPTNFLDIEHIDWLAEYLNSVKGTFLVISHDTDFLNRVCRFIVNIENGGIRKYSGNYSEFMVQREQNARQYEDSYNRQQREIEKMQDYINRNKARAATAGMANARKKQLEKMEIIKKPTVVYDAEFSFPYVALHTKDLLKIKDLSIGYEKGKPLLPPVNIEMGSETKLWIRGTNGIGKTTLIKTVMGLLAPLSGTYFYHPAAAVGYLAQDLDFGGTEHNATAYFSERFPRAGAKEVRGALAKTGIKNDLATKPLCDLSGGEQVRVKLCVLMQKPTNLLVLDEPTNHLDIRAKAALLTALTAYEGAILLVSHEKDFAGEICSEIFDARA